MNSIYTANARHFFSKKSKEAAEDAEKAAAAEEKDDADVKEEIKKDEQPADKEQQATEAAEEGDKKKEESSSSESSEGTSSEEVELTNEDIKKIKALIAEQDETIEKNKERIAELEKYAKDMKRQLVQQVADNENTIKRYRKLEQDAKVFAISKFAKDLLDVRDALGLAMQHVDLDKIKESDDTDLLKE